MARLLTSGFEIQCAAAEAASTNVPDGRGTGTSFDTTVKRTGNSSLKITGTDFRQFLWNGTTGGANGVNYYARFYFRFDSAQSALRTVFAIGVTGGYICKTRLATDNTLELWRGDSVAKVGSSSAALSTGVWYRLEMRCKTTVGGAADELELRLDGTVVASSNTETITDAVPNIIVAGDPVNAVTGSFYFDDFAFNDDTGVTAQNTWPGAGNVVLKIPRQDSQKGSWTGGTDGTGEDFGAINSSPPIGTASETNLTQIENVDTSPDNSTDEYRGNLGPYTGDLLYWKAFGATTALGDATARTRVAVKFVPPNDCTVSRIGCVLIKTGTPVDNVQGEIYSDSGGSPGSSLAAAATIVAGGTVSATVSSIFSGAYSATLTGGTTYWIVFTRSGAVSGTNFYSMSGSVGASGDGSAFGGVSWTNNTTKLVYWLAVSAGPNSVPATATVQVIQAVVNHGEDASTGTKTGSFGGQSNPSWTYDTFTYGDDVGALGTYPTNWRWAISTAQVTPTVTLASDFILALRKTDTGSRVASADFLGAYVDYTVATGRVPRSPGIDSGFGHL